MESLKHIKTLICYTKFFPCIHGNSISFFLGHPVLTNVACTNVIWTNSTGLLVNSQGWFHKLEMASSVLSLGCGGVEINANSVVVVVAGGGGGVWTKFSVQL